MRPKTTSVLNDILPIAKEQMHKIVRSPKFNHEHYIKSSFRSKQLWLIIRKKLNVVEIL
jgi:hypothetical protein